MRAAVGLAAVFSIAFAGQVAAHTAGATCEHIVITNTPANEPAYIYDQPDHVLVTGPVGNGSYAVEAGVYRVEWPAWDNGQHHTDLTVQPCSTPTPVPTPTPTEQPTPSPTPTATPDPTPTPGCEQTEQGCPTPTPTATPAQSVEPTATPCSTSPTDCFPTLPPTSTDGSDGTPRSDMTGLLLTVGIGVFALITLIPVRRRR